MWPVIAEAKEKMRERDRHVAVGHRHCRYPDCDLDRPTDGPGYRLASGPRFGARAAAHQHRHANGAPRHRFANGDPRRRLQNGCGGPHHRLRRLPGVPGVKARWWQTVCPLCA